MCFCFTSNENCHFSSEKPMRPQNVLLIFIGKETHSETKSWKSSRILSKKSYNNNGKPWKPSRILRANPNFFIFLSFFIIFLHCFRFFLFFSFSLFSFSFFSFFHFLLFSFFFFVRCSKFDFFGPQFRYDFS